MSDKLIVYTDEHKAQMLRNATILRDNLTKIQDLAWRAINEYNGKPNELVVACIEVGSSWQPILELVKNLEYDWDTVKEIYDDPVFTGIFKSEDLRVALNRSVPDTSFNEIQETSDNMVTVVILNGQYYSLYEVEPKLEGKPH